MDTLAGTKREATVEVMGGRRRTLAVRQERRGDHPRWERSAGGGEAGSSRTGTEAASPLT